ncbi:MAG TPA: hypothetical protein VHG27_08330 [Xanthobacteraceae bacterium]|nr:hypothetical protein [Xanthobacteraceae bacterium]
MPRFFRLRATAVLAGFLTLAPLAPVAAQPAEPVYPPALRVGLVPPADFVPSTSFFGFQHKDKQASIILSELPAYAYENIEKEISAELQKNPDGVVRQDLELKDGARGFLLKGSQNGPQGAVLKWTMVATAGEVTALVTALIPEAVKEVAPEEAIRASFATLAVRASVPLQEKLSVLPFAMEELAGFRIVRVQPGSAAMLTDGPKDSIESAEQPILLVALGPMGTQPAPAERDGLARRMIGQTPGLTEMRVVRSEPLRIANQQGHEILVEAKDAKTGVDIKAVQWLRFGSGTLLRIVGLARKEDWDGTYSRFRKVRDGVGSR